MRIYRNLFKLGLILTISSIYSVQNQSPTTEKPVKKTTAKPATSFQIGDLAKNFHSWQIVQVAKKINLWAALQAVANLGFFVAVLVLAIKLNKNNKDFTQLKEKITQLETFSVNAKTKPETIEPQIQAMQLRLNRIEETTGEIRAYQEQLTRSRLPIIERKAAYYYDEKARLLDSIELLVTALTALRSIMNDKDIKKTQTTIQGLDSKIAKITTTLSELRSSLTLSASRPGTPTTPRTATTAP